MDKPPNFAVQRLDAYRLAILQSNPNPPRSEVVDMMLTEALEREDQIAEAKAEKGGAKGLRAAQRQPAKIERAVQPNQGTDYDVTSFFENLLAPAGPTDTNSEKDGQHDN